MAFPAELGTNSDPPYGLSSLSSDETKCFLQSLEFIIHFKYKSTNKTRTDIFRAKT